MIELITFDLDDTLWDNGPVIRRAVHEGYSWLLQQHPELAKIHDVSTLDALKESIRTSTPDLEYRVSEVRIVGMMRALQEIGYDATTARQLAEEAFDHFTLWRHKVELFAGTEQMLATLAKHYRLGVITNGNVDVRCIGLGDYFAFSVSADTLNCAKPSPVIFEHALRTANVAPENTLHVGDNLITDVHGAANLGMKTLWFNPENRPLPANSTVPDITVNALADIPAAIKIFLASHAYP